MQIYDYRSGSKKIRKSLHPHLCNSVHLHFKQQQQKTEPREAKGINVLEPGTELGASNIVTQVRIALANHLEVTH